MHFSTLFVLAVATVGEAKYSHQVRYAHGHGHLHKRQAAGSLTLDTNVIQATGNGNKNGSIAAGQVASQTSTNNFINICSGKTLTNGLQIITGSCNGIPMGDIPAKTNMISSIITFPLPGSATIESNTDFNITVQVSNLVPGSFTNAAATYYAGPQFLQDGKIVGHTHVTVQDTGASLNPTKPLDPTKFAFFKGINDAGNGDGLLSATVTGGLPAGNYRVCTLTSASNHQAVLMPVAQRGGQDDCTKFTVIGTGTTKNAAANDGTKGIAAAALAASAVQAGGGFVVPPAATSATGIKSDDGSGAISTVASNTTTAIRALSTSAPFTNSTVTTKKGNGGGNAKPTKITAETTKAGVSIKASASASADVSAKASETTKALSATKVVSARPGKPTGKRVITIIKTFFIFRHSKGAACPAVNKSGNKFDVLGELFDSLDKAASAACGHQFTACVKFTGPGFSFQECATQKDECAAVATTQVATATTAQTFTASVTIPVTAAVPTDIPGTVVATETIAATATSSVVAAAATAAPTGIKDEAVPDTCSVVMKTVTVDVPKPTASPSESECAAVVTSTVTVDAPVATAATSAAPVVSAGPVVSAADECSVVISTITVDPPAASATLVSSTSSFSNGTASATGAARRRRVIR